MQIQIARRPICDGGVVLTHPPIEPPWVPLCPKVLLHQDVHKKMVFVAWKTDDRVAIRLASEPPPSIETYDPNEFSLFWYTQEEESKPELTKFMSLVKERVNFMLFTGTKSLSKGTQIYNLVGTKGDRRHNTNGGWIEWWFQQMQRIFDGVCQGQLSKDECYSDHNDPRDTKALSVPKNQNVIGGHVLEGTQQQAGATYWIILPICKSHNYYKNAEYHWGSGPVCSSVMHLDRNVDVITIQPKP